jgi:hypothetical protein
MCGSRKCCLGKKEGASKQRFSAFELASAAAGGIITNVRDPPSNGHQDAQGTDAVILERGIECVAVCVVMGRQVQAPRRPSQVDASPSLHHLPCFSLPSACAGCGVACTMPPAWPLPFPRQVLWRWRHTGSTHIHGVERVAKRERGCWSRLGWTAGAETIR